MRRIVVKIGSNALTRPDGRLDVTRMSALVDQIAWLRAQGCEVILVSSGAVACGRRELDIEHELDSVEQRQLFSAMGQAKLIGLYYDLFREYHIHVGQVLTMKENFQPGEQYRNQQACMRVMLENGVLPIVNENDTVSVTLRPTVAARQECSARYRPLTIYPDREEFCRSWWYAVEICHRIEDSGCRHLRHHCQRQARQHLD